MKSNNFLQFVRNAFVILDGGNRPITLMFLFTVIKLVPSDPYFTIDHIPIILGPALALAIYFLTRELTSNDIASLLAAFLTIVSFHTLVGLYAGYYANWFALIIGYLSFVFLFRFLKTSNKLNVVIYFLLLVLTLFTHSYTWTILTMVAGIFLLVMLKFNYYYKKCIILVLLVTVFTVVIDIAKFAITSSPGGIEQDVNVASIYTVGVGQLPVRWNNLIDTTEIYYGAAFSNVIILTLGLYWLFRSCIREQSTIFVMIFLSLGILPLFFGNWLVQSRVFYNIPFQIPAAIALVYIKKQTNGTIMLVPICIWLISMAVSAVSNFA